MKSMRDYRASLEFFKELMTGLLTIASLLALVLPLADTEADRLFWPAPPDEARVEYVGQIDCRKLTPKSSFLGKVAGFVGGRSEQNELLLPFDVLIVDERMFLICQNLPALVEIDRKRGNFKLHYDKKAPFAYPIAMADGGDGTVFVTDSEAGSIYKFKDGKIKEFITEHLLRPTGITAKPKQRKIYVVDTGEHNVKVFGYDGALLNVFPDLAETENRLNFPTFAVTADDGDILVNDALNFRVVRMDEDGNIKATFGSECDGPGCFARPKGIAVNGDGHVYVMDNLFDNLQIFDSEGRILLAVGGSGQNRGEFWSPGGIDIVDDTIFIADTYNNRIQILHYLGEPK